VNDSSGRFYSLDCSVGMLQPSRFIDISWAQHQTNVNYMKCNNSPTSLLQIGDDGVVVHVIRSPQASRACHGL
jgi:hypothetical protein